MAVFGRDIHAPDVGAMPFPLAFLTSNTEHPHWLSFGRDGEEEAVIAFGPALGTELDFLPGEATGALERFAKGLGVVFQGTEAELPRLVEEIDGEREIAQWGVGRHAGGSLNCEKTGRWRTWWERTLWYRGWWMCCGLA